MNARKQRKKRQQRVARAENRRHEHQHHRRHNLPPGYSLGFRSYGYALYRGSWSVGIRHDDRIGGYRPEEYDVMLLHAWEDYDA